MIREGNVFVTAFHRGLRHLRDGRAAVAPHAVHLQIALDSRKPINLIRQQSAGCGDGKES
jgi:hypothetical protein